MRPLCSELYIIKSTLNVPTTPAACYGTSSSVKRSEKWSHPIPSIGLGRHTTTTTSHTKWKVFFLENCLVYSIKSCEFFFRSKNMPIINLPDGWTDLICSTSKIMACRKLFSKTKLKFI